MSKLRQVEDYVSPFAEYSEHFSQSWWASYQFDSCDNLYERGDYFSFSMNQIEVARSTVYETPLFDSYAGLSIGEEECVRRIQFFEVNELYRHRGVGLHVADLICEYYPRQLIVAMSKNSDTDIFWAKTRLKHYLRLPEDDRDMKIFGYDVRGLAGE